MTHTKQAARAIVAAWNSRHPAGTLVIYVDDDGKEHETETRSPAWLDGGEPVIDLNGQPLCVSLSRTIPALSFADHQIEPITVRVFVKDGLCEQVFRNHPNRRLRVTLESEIYDGDGDCHDEYEAALAECEQGSGWTPIY